MYDRHVFYTLKTRNFLIEKLYNLNQSTMRTKSNLKLLAMIALIHLSMAEPSIQTGLYIKGDYETTSMIPLHNILYDANINDGIAQVDISMEFINNFNRNIETEYMFPISIKSVFHEFEATFEDGSTIVGEIKEKAAAKAEYE